MAEGDDFETPDRRSSSTGRERLQCYKCGSGFYFGGDADRTRCSSCSKNVLVWRARLAAYGESRYIQELAEGPKTSRDLEAEPTNKVRDVVQKLRPPGNDGRGKGLTVYYLPGDERRAVDTFIDANHAFEVFYKNWTQRLRGSTVSISSIDG